MRNVEELIDRLTACGNERDVFTVASTAYAVVMEAMALLYRAADEELPCGDSFRERMGGRAVGNLVRENNLASAFDYVRVLG